MANIIYKKKLPHNHFITFDDKPNIPNLVHLEQVHGIDLIKSPYKQSIGDGFIIDEISHNFAIKTADCVPVAIQGKKTIFLHAGWRGINKGILISKNIENIEPTSLFLGPHIKSCCYQVGNDFYQHFDQKYFNLKNNKIFFDMEQVIRDQITRSFVNCHIQSALICTHCTKNFNSYRKNSTKRRNWNILTTDDFKTGDY